MYLLGVLVQYNIIIHAVYGYLKCGSLNHYSWKGGHVGPEYTSQKPEKEILYCTYKINNYDSYTGYSTVLTWNKFDILSLMPECYRNFVVVYTGCGLAKKKVARFCSLNADKPFPIYSHDGCIEIVYRLSSQFNGGDGFSASYNKLVRGTPIEECPKTQELIASSGVFSSSRWPEPYRYSVGGRYHKKSCKWKMARPRENMLVVIMDLDLVMDTSASLSRRDVLKLNYHDNLYNVQRKHKIYENNITLSEFEKFQTHSTFKLSLLTFSNYYWGSKKNRGFVLGYMAYGDRVTRTTTIKTTTTTIGYDDDDGKDDAVTNPIAIVIIIMFIFPFIIGCFMCCIKRRMRRDSHEENNDNERPLNEPEGEARPNSYPRLLDQAEWNGNDCRDSPSYENQTNGVLTDEAPPAYNPNNHLNYPSVPPSNTSAQTNEEAPPPTYEQVVQGINVDTTV